MKRRTLAIILIICLLVCAIPGASAASDVIFTAANDTLVPSLAYQPYVLNGTVYVPCWVFSNYFPIYYNYFSDSSTALVYNDSKQLYFELSSGNTYDSSNNFYSASAVFRSGQVYLPAVFICSQFGLTYSYITGSDYGDLVRVKDSTAVLDDSVFLSAAENQMETQYKTYKGPSTSAPKPSVPPTRPGNGLTNHGSTSVYLSFQGMPSEATLSALKRRNITTCFFLTADEVVENTDMVRNIVNSGHRVGVFCGAEGLEDFEQTSALIFEVSREKTILVSSSAENRAACLDMADENSLVYWGYDTDGALLNPDFLASTLESAQSEVSVRIKSGAYTDAVLPSFLYYLVQNSFTIREVREINNYE